MKTVGCTVENFFSIRNLKKTYLVWVTCFWPFKYNVTKLPTDSIQHDFNDNINYCSLHPWGFFFKSTCDFFTCISLIFLSIENIGSSREEASQQFLNSWTYIVDIQLYIPVNPKLLLRNVLKSSLNKVLEYIYLSWVSIDVIIC